MKTALPALIAALSVALAPVPSFAERGGRGHGNGHGAQRGEIIVCPPGLAKRDPFCLPPGQAGRSREEDSRRRGGDEGPEWVGVEPGSHRDRGGRERADRDEGSEWVGVEPERERRPRDDGDESGAALAIVGALLGLALIERSQDQGSDGGHREEAHRAAPAAPAPWVPPEIPARPESFAFLDRPAAPTAAPPAIAPRAPERAAASDTSLIPPPPPMADDLSAAPQGSARAPTSDELSDAFRRAQDAGATGF